MTRIIAAALLVILATPSWAEEVIHCTDSDAVGFRWHKGEDQPRKAGYALARFTVKAVSKTKRIIDWPSEERSLEYKCHPIAGPALVCSLQNLPALWTIIFKGNRYERVNNFSSLVGGDPDLFVAYGTCSKS